jgi:hypothetical protein
MNNLLRGIVDRAVLDRYGETKVGLIDPHDLP